MKWKMNENCFMFYGKIIETINFEEIKMWGMRVEGKGFHGNIFIKAENSFGSRALKWLSLAG